MKLSLELLNVLGLILPGLMAIKLQDTVSTSEDRPLHEQVILALIYSYLIYLLSGLILGSWEPLIAFREVSESIEMTLSTNKLQILTIIVLTIALPLLFSWSKQKDIPMKWLRWLKVTKKSSMANTWSDSFHNEKRMVQIYFKDERIVRGWPHRYSSDPEEGFIYLAGPVWVNTAKKDESEPDYIETNAHGFLISREEIDFIEFSLKRDETQENIAEGDWNE